MNSHRLKNKLLFCSETIWKKIFFYKQSYVFKNQEKLIYERSSTIPKILIGSEVSIYSGKKWIKKNINRWMVGFKFGEFTWNKRVAIYKAKQLRKKKKKWKINWNLNNFFKYIELKDFILLEN